MKILFGKCFGLGNSVMSVPAIKALLALGHEVDILVGSMPDDRGAFQVMERLRSFLRLRSSLHVDHARGKRYDLAIMSIPFDGRWKNGEHFVADRVVDGRTRPDPSTLGLVSWKRHEVEYQMDNVRELGYVGEIPDTRFDRSDNVTGRDRKVYLGVGYKKDLAGFWAKKHWGNENFARLAAILVSMGFEVITTGDEQDVVMSIAPIIRMSSNSLRLENASSIERAFDVIKDCALYVGNDTGTAHVAASFGLDVVTIHNLENSIIKSHPWSPREKRVELDGSQMPVTVDDVCSAIERVSPKREVV